MLCVSRGLPNGYKLDFVDVAIEYIEILYIVGHPNFNFLSCDRTGQRGTISPNSSSWPIARYSSSLTMTKCSLSISVSETYNSEICRTTTNNKLWIICTICIITNPQKNITYYFKYSTKLILLFFF